MHHSLNLLAQRISKLSVRSYIQDTTPADGVSNKPLPPLPSEIRRSRIGRPVISLPVPGSFVDLCKSEESSREAIPDHPQRNQRKSSEMPLSTHPPLKRSWIEVQPLRTYTIESRTVFKSGVNQSIANVAETRAGVYKEPPHKTASRSYHGTTLPPPPLPPWTYLPNIPKRRPRSQSKSAVAKLQLSDSTYLLELPIAPLTSRRHEDITPRPTEPTYLSGARVSAGQHPAVESVPSHGYIPLPSALHDRWAKRSSSHVILADNSLQLKVFSELGVELDEVLGLYTPGEMS
jgi:hypothetical protein